MQINVRFIFEPPDAEGRRVWKNLRQPAEHPMNPTRWKRHSGTLRGKVVLHSFATPQGGC
jgi:hypothetical protein